MNDFVTVENFAPRISMPTHAVYRAIREGQFPFPVVKIGRQIRIDARALNAPPPQKNNSETAEPTTNQQPAALAA